jgi:protein tyrosine/serine phosphatase
MPSKVFRNIPNENIYIGNLEDAANPALLREHRIAAVLNVSDHCTPDGYDGDIARFHVRLSDPQDTLCDSNPLVEAVEVFFVARERALIKGGNVLVHCINGHNRSSLVVALWLVRTTGCSLKEAVKIAQVRTNKPWMKHLGYVWDE